MTNYRIPFNKPELSGNEFRYVFQAIEAGWISGDGKFTKKCQDLLGRELNVQKVLLTTSCTHALEMAGLLLDLQPGDEVIIPSFTFVSTVNAFVLRGIKPVFVDIRPDTLNMDEARLEMLITPRTRAIVPVHYAGVACEMDSILEIAKRHGVPVIEDNAHGMFARYKGKFLGTFGCIATQSFHETKNFTCGEGGALLINDERFCDRAEVLREKGTNRSRFFRGEVDKYTWVDIGSSYLPSDILAAFLLAQLEAREEIFRKRRQIWEFYFQHLEAYAARNGIQLPTVPQHCEQPFHMFYMVLPSLEERQRLISRLREKGINAIFHYLPLHLSEMGQKFGGKPGDCPVTERVTDSLVRLPFYNSLNEQDQEEIVRAIMDEK